MKRRNFLLLLSAAMTAARRVGAQQKAMPVVGQLSVFSAPADLGDLLRGPIHQGMSELGFVEGQNMIWVYRWAEGHYERLPMLAADLVGRKVDVIVTYGGAPPALAAKNATSTIPIVFTGVGDPVGLVASLARPGSNPHRLQQPDCRTRAQADRVTFRAGSPGCRDRSAREPGQ